MANLTTGVAALLWCNYREFAKEGLFGNENVPDSLVDLMISAVFGPHVSQHEVTAWKELESAFQP
jgi:hypothetical protein